MDGVSVRRHVLGHGRVAEIVLERPEALNALNTAMAVRLAQVCAELGPDRGVCAVVLTATGGRAFSVGADLKERNAMSDAQLLAPRSRACSRSRSRSSRPCTGGPWAAAVSSPCPAT
jgi:enoyl-CoA hydratase/carnithine racemase